MRILHVNKFNYRRGGADGCMLDTVELQRGAGHDVEVFAMQHPQNESSRFDSEFPSYVEFDPAPRRPSAQVRAVARMLWSRSAAAGVGRTIDVFRPDVAHVHSIYHQLSPSVLAPLARACVPIVMTLHDFKLVCPSHGMLDHGQPCEACIPHRFHQAALHRCKNDSLVASSLLAVESSFHRLARLYDPVDLFICPSRFLRTKMVAGNVFPDRLRSLPNFTDAVRLAPKSEPGGPVVFVGRLNHQKGVDVLVTAAPSLPDGARVVIIGDGPERDALERLASTVAPGRVHFSGALDRAAARDVMRSAGVVVLPSRGYENQPLVILDALALGVPVVGTDIGGIPELILEGSTGYVVPVEDPSALAAAVSRVVTDPERARAMGRSGREFVEGAFSPEAHLGALLAIYDEAAERSAAARR
jgi:glycosyltransferase involved in cell wall biosynthesis